MGGVTKLKIIAFKSATDTSKQKTYDVLINPEQLETTDKVTYTKVQAPGTAGPQLRFRHIPTQEITLNLVFDSTGLINNAKEKTQQKTVAEQIDDFKETTIQYQGDIHEPYYVQLLWGDFSFVGYLTKLDITYKLFKPDGSPIRATAKATFNSSVNSKKSKKRQKKSSPDMTHIRQIRAGDRLPNMCNDIYQGPNYYVQVAKHNGLNQIRQIKPGVELSFPPLTH